MGEREATAWVHEAQAADSAGHAAPGVKGTRCFLGGSGYTEAPSPSRPLGGSVGLSWATVDHDQNRVESRGQGQSVTGPGKPTWQSLEINAITYKKGSGQPNGAERQERVCLW